MLRLVHAGHRVGHRVGLHVGCRVGLPFGVVVTLNVNGHDQSHDHLGLGGHHDLSWVFKVGWSFLPKGFHEFDVLEGVDDVVCGPWM
jgi:hypothetical protein